MNFQSPALRDALAAEYLLNNLTPRARRRYERAMAGEPALAADVARWRRRFDQLAAADGIAPPARVWAGIEQALERGEAQRRRRLARAGQGPALRLWQAWSALATAAALVLAVLLFRQDRSFSEPGARAADEAYAAMLEVPKETAARWQISLDARQRLFSVRAVGYPMLETDEDYELWWVSGEEVVSLGLLPRDGTWQRTLPRHVPIGRANRLVITREPAYGSPTDGPTGPVLVDTALRARR